MKENTINSKNRTHVIRQDRHSLSDLRCYLSIGSNQFEVINYSAFGVAIQSKESFPEKFTAENCSLLIEDSEIASLSIKKVREEKFGIADYRTGFEITSEPLSTERLAVFPEIWQITQNIFLEQARLKEVPLAFVANVYKMKDLLQRLEKKIIELQISKDFLSKREVEDFESTIIAVTGKAIYEAWQSAHADLANALESQQEKTIKNAFNFFREQMRSVIYQSPFATRTLKKPRGYAGDYEMMNLIYRNQDMGATLFGRCMERSFLICPEPEAVRERAKYIEGKIIQLLHSNKQEKLKILSVASGPAFEIQKLAATLSEAELNRLEVILLDQDIDSLKHAQKEIRRSALNLKKKFDVSLIHKTIKETITSGLPEIDFDFIYSAGLFDYFSDAVAHTAGKVFIKHVKNNGKVIIGNFDVSTPNRFTMNLVFDWNLMYRSREDLQKLFKYENTSLEIEHEKNGINLFCIIDRKG